MTWEIEGGETEGCLMDKADFSTPSRQVGTTLEMTISGLRFGRDDKREGCSAGLRIMDSCSFDKLGTGSAGMTLGQGE